MKRRSFLQALVGVPAVVATAQLAAKLPTIAPPPTSNYGFGLATLKEEGKAIVYDQRVWPGIKNWYDNQYAKNLAKSMRDLKEQVAFDVLSRYQ
jgi:hypothetical protein